MMKGKLPLNQIIRTDCLVMKRWRDDGCVDLVLTDPPYMISSEVVITRGRNKMKFKGSDIKSAFGDWDRFDSVDAFMVWTFSWVDEAVRLLRPGGMFCCYFDRDKVNFLSRYLQSRHGFRLKGYFADCKSNPVPQARKVGWMSGWEVIGMWQKPGGKLTYNYEWGQCANYAIRAIVGNTTKEDGRRVHPTQKPIGLARNFVRYWSNKGDVVLDPFSGSGWACIAAKKEGRVFCGIDESAEYCGVARRRLKAVRPSLFEKPRKKKARESFGLCE